MTDEPPPYVCGSTRVVETYEGHARATRWCDRTDGPCPFPGTEQHGDRPCTGPRVMRVRWADTAIQGAHDDLAAMSRALDNGDIPDLTTSHGESLWVALDALRACGAEENHD